MSEETLPITLEMLYDEGGLREPSEQLAECIKEHTAARGVDVWATHIRGHTASEWAEMTGRDRSTVSRNIRRATE